MANMGELRLGRNHFLNGPSRIIHIRDAIKRKLKTLLLGNSKVCRIYLEKQRKIYFCVNILLMNRLLLYYLRNFPIEIGKKRLSRLLKLNKIAGDIVFLNYMGVKFILNINEYVMKQIFMFGIYEKPYIKLLTSFPENQIRTIIDIGANIGNYTLSFKKKYPNTIIHSFEPNSINAERLRKNIELNQFSYIKVNQLGLSDNAGELKLYFDEKNMGGASLAEKAGNNFEVIKLTTLDDYCLENKIDQIDILKIDIEGGEIFCLNGACKILNKTQKGILQLEIDYSHCKRMGYSYIDLFNFPIQFGYAPFLINFMGRLVSIKELKENFIGNVIYLKGY